MSDPTLAIGEVVYLKSGSAPMTITLFVPDGNIRVTWMDSGAIKSSKFPRAALTSRKPRYGEWATNTVPDAPALDDAKGKQ